MNGPVWPNFSAAQMGVTLTRASPTPSAKSPVKWSSCDGLSVKIRQQNREYPPLRHGHERV